MREIIQFYQEKVITFLSNDFLGEVFFWGGAQIWQNESREN